MILAAASSVGRRVALLWVTVALASSAQARDEAPVIRAVATVVPPFVIEERGQLTGFSIDLWNEVAVRLGVKTRYLVVPEAAGLLDALRSNEADVVVSVLFYTAELDREFDFTYPTLNAGLQVMVPSEGQGTADRPLEGVLRVLLSRAMLHWIGAALLLILLPAHVIWLLDRRSKDGISPSEKYFPGIFHAMEWAAEALLAQAMQMPRRRVAHLLAILWLFAGVVFVAFFTAQLTATLTVEQIRGAINGPQDLPGKRVATMAGSVSAAYARGIGAQVSEFTRPDEMYSALSSRKVDAVLMAAPLLRYHAAHDGAGKVRLVGPEFRKGDAGLVVPLNSPLRKKISTTLVTLREDGAYQRIYEKWFGSE